MAVGLAVGSYVVLPSLGGLKSRFDVNVTSKEVETLTSYAAAPPMISWLNLALCSSD